MEETSKVVSSYFIKKSHRMDKMEEELSRLRESLDRQRKEEQARSVEINCLQGLFAQANSEKEKLQAALNNVNSQLKGKEATRNVAQKELQEKEQEVQQLKVASRYATQIQAQLWEEFRLKEEYTQYLSNVQVTLSEEREKFETTTREMQSSLEKTKKELQNVKGLL